MMIQDLYYTFTAACKGRYRAYELHRKEKKEDKSY